MSALSPFLRLPAPLLLAALATVPAQGQAGDTLAGPVGCALVRATELHGLGTVREDVTLETLSRRINELLSPTTIQGAVRTDGGSLALMTTALCLTKDGKRHKCYKAGGVYPRSRWRVVYEVGDQGPNESRWEGAWPEFDERLVDTCIERASVTDADRKTRIKDRPVFLRIYSFGFRSSPGLAEHDLFAQDGELLSAWSLRLPPKTGVY